MRDKASWFLRGHGAFGTVVVLALIIVFIWVVLRWLTPPEGGIDVRDRAQLHSMETAVELFNAEFDTYPPSDANDSTGQPYCGAMKLAEAIMGQDLMGVHVRSGFRVDGLDPNSGAVLYPSAPGTANLQARKGPYLQAESACAHRLVDIYGAGNTGPFREDLYVLCDVWKKKRLGGKKTGMPILYFRANPNGTMHDVNDPNNPTSFYDYRDNLALLKLGVPGEPNAVHPLADPKRFYLNTRNEKVAGQSRPYRADSCILISAGWDGLYGTADDICNFNWQYRER